MLAVLLDEVRPDHGELQLILEEAPPDARVEHHVRGEAEGSAVLDAGVDLVRARALVERERRRLAAERGGLVDRVVGVDVETVDRIEAQADLAADLLEVGIVVFPLQLAEREGAEARVEAGVGIVRRVPEPERIAAREQDLIEDEVVIAVRFDREVLPTPNAVTPRSGVVFGMRRYDSTKVGLRNAVPAVRRMLCRGVGCTTIEPRGEICGSGRSGC